MCVAIKIFDITFVLDEETKVYEGDPHFIKEEVFTLEKDGFALSMIRMGSHAGTHTDAPSHFIQGGKTLLDIPLCNYIGECLLIVMDGLKDLPPCEKVLIKSAPDNDARLNARQARALIKKGVKLVGTDALSIGDDSVHRILLENDCVIIERLKLDGVSEGQYTLYALPLKIDADGSPIRACLIPASKTHKKEDV